MGRPPTPALSLMNKTAPPQDEVVLYVRYFLGQAACEGKIQPRADLIKIRDAHSLLVWADKWATDDEWRRARDNVRSHRYKSRHKLARANIDQATKEALEQRARARGLPLWRYVQQLELTEEKLERLEHFEQHRTANGPSISLRKI